MTTGTWHEFSVDDLEEFAKLNYPQEWGEPE
jgi:hypothetical protein